jgi:hypothetical protein
LWILQDFFYFAIVDETVLLVLAELRKHLYLNLINLELVSHDEKKSQRCHLSLLLWVILLELLEISLLWTLFDIVLSQLASDLPDVLQAT